MKRIFLIILFVFIFARNGLAITISLFTFGDEQTTDSEAYSENNLVRLSPTKFVHVWRDGVNTGTGNIMARMGTLDSSNSITWSTKYTVQSGSYKSCAASMIHPSATEPEVLVVYNVISGNENGAAEIISVNLSTGVITVSGNSEDFDYGPRYMGTDYITDGYVAIGYHDHYDDEGEEVDYLMGTVAVRTDVRTLQAFPQETCDPCNGWGAPFVGDYAYGTELDTNTLSNWSHQNVRVATVDEADKRCAFVYSGISRGADSYGFVLAATVNGGLDGFNAPGAILTLENGTGFVTERLNIERISDTKAFVLWDREIPVDPMHFGCAKGMIVDIEDDADPDVTGNDILALNTPESSCDGSDNAWISWPWAKQLSDTLMATAWMLNGDSGSGLAGKFKLWQVNSDDTVTEVSGSAQNFYSTSASLTYSKYSCLEAMTDEKALLVYSKNAAGDSPNDYSIFRVVIWDIDSGLKYTDNDATEILIPGERFYQSIATFEANETLAASDDLTSAVESIRSTFTEALTLSGSGGSGTEITVSNITVTEIDMVQYDYVTWSSVMATGGSNWGVHYTGKAPTNHTFNNCILHGGSTAVVESHDSWVFNNCVIHSSAGDGIQMSSPTSIAPVVTNCIFDGITGLDINENGTGATSTGSNNCFEDSYADLVTGGHYNDSGGSNLYSTDPLFMNAANGDFRLRLDSPARGAATDPIALGLTEDFRERKYRASGPWDIGPYQSSRTFVTLGEMILPIYLP